MSTFGKCEGGGRRSAARTPAPLIGLATTLNETRTAVVVDVSATGAQLRGTNLPLKHASLFINIEGVVTFGTVQWENGDDRGIVFDRPLAPTDEQFLHQKVRESRGLPPQFKAGLDEWSAGVAR